MLEQSNRLRIPENPPQQPTQIISFPLLSPSYRARYIALHSVARNSSPAAFLDPESRCCSTTAAPEAAARFRRNCRLSRAISFYSDFIYSLCIHLQKSSENLGERKFHGQQRYNSLINIFSRLSLSAVYVERRRKHCR